MDNFDGYIADIYREMEQELIASMQRNLGLHEAEEAVTGLNYPQWQAQKLKELKRFQRESEQIIGSAVSGLPDEVSRHMIDELNQGSLHELKRYREALGKGYKPAKVMKDSFFRVNDRKVTALIDALNNDLQRANTAVLRMMNDQYRQTIFKAGMFVSNGVYTEKQAVKKAVEEFAAKGLNCIEYKDGRRVNIADYASMAVRTANQRAYMVGEGEFRKAIGETLVIISRHSTSCELCKPFEGKVLIDDVYSGGSREDGDYMLLSQAMEQGLYHPRCRHGLGTYYPELEDINGYETEENRLNDYGLSKTGVAKSEKSDIIEAGGKSIVDFAEWDANRTEAARKQYDKIRSADDVEAVARSSGFSAKDIQAIKNHIFYKKHIKYDGEVELFEADYDMAVAWKRLVDGNPEERDILLLKHELLESQLEQDFGLTAAEAHERANQTYAWDKKLYEELGEGGEEDDLL